MKSLRDHALYLSPGEGRFVFGLFFEGGDGGWGIGFTWFSVNGG